MIPHTPHIYIQENLYVLIGKYSIDIQTIYLWAFETFGLLIILIQTDLTQ